MQKVKSKHGDFHTNPPCEEEMFGVADFSCMEIRRIPKCEVFKNIIIGCEKQQRKRPGGVQAITLEVLKEMLFSSN